MKTVTLCGSMRFTGEMTGIALELELHHHMNVLQCVYNPASIPLTEKDREALAAAHRKKIDLSDAVYVADIGGYIGDSVRAEITYARERGIEVIYHSRFMGAR